jgi:uncharacterized protein YyaL (SSP411 family)
MPNRLALESSPYLRQHAGNPVDWYPWGEEAFARARAEDKPIHLSVGYFACHWCHVMAHESFEDPALAAQLNADFINVKVDRQERPDVDDLYQRVVQMMGEGGGWPLTVFLTPAREPFFAGTYFPPQERYGRPAFPRLLQVLARAWRERRQEVQSNVAQFVRGWQEHDEQLFAPLEPAPADDLPREAALAFARATDAVHGGMGGKPKFPNVSCLDLMLRLQARVGAQRLGDDERTQLFLALQRTLDGMAGGGIYDHLGGGFARYGVDERWEVPHFEKMLYDNAQLVKIYADAWRHAPQPAWRAVFEQSCDYVLRDLTHPQGGFCAGEDADSEGEEGRFYVWSAEQIRAVLGADDGAFALRAYGVTEAGNFAGGRSVLQRRLALGAAEAARLEPLRTRLLAARAQRVRPGRDDNILAGWNGLMIQGLCAAYQASGTRAYLDAARRAADFLGRHLTRADGGLLRAWRDGVAGGPGFLDDHADVAHAHFDLYESAFEPADLQRGLALVDRILEDFWDGGLYFTPRDAADLPHRPLAPFDGACPSGLSAAVLALLRAYAYCGTPRYADRAHDMLARFEAASARNFFGFSHLLAAREFDRQGPALVAFAGAGPALRELQAAAQGVYLGARTLGRLQDLHGQAALEAAPAAGAPAAAYVCRAQSCLPPVHTGAELVAALGLAAR